MTKCRYSIDGTCTNENVACEKCNSSEYEMRACTPFQRCIALHDDNWAIEVEDTRKISIEKIDEMQDVKTKLSTCELNEVDEILSSLDDEQCRILLRLLAYEKIVNKMK